MRILILQHAHTEHPGVFRDFLNEDGHQWDVVEMDKGGHLPDLEAYDALWVLGGPMDVWEEDKYPWLREEKSFIRKAVEEKGMPFLGLCLGHQLLAEALGGTVGKSDRPEIGICEVQLTEMGATGILFDDLPERFSCLQWHGAEVKQMPAGGQCLATSADCAVQAMRWGNRAYSLQFHIEVEEDTVRNWAEIPEYSEALEHALGQGAVERLDRECAAQMGQFKNMAERLYMNWLQTSARSLG